MRKRVLAMLLLVALTLTSVGALANEGLSAKLEGGVLTVAWSPVSGECTLTVCKNDWPLSCISVNGAKGEAATRIVDDGGHYTVRLSTGNGCMTADVVRNEAPTAKQEHDGEPVGTTPKTVEPEKKPAAQPMKDSGSMRSDLAAQVVAQVNAEREKNGLSALRVDEELTCAAAVRAREIAQSFSHTRPDGRAWATVSAVAYGENIAMGQKTADKVMAAWLSSEGHRANIMKASYGSIGVAAWVSGGVVYWVQLFGK